MKMTIDEIIESEQATADFHKRIVERTTSPKNKSEAQKYLDYHNQIIDIMHKYQEIFDKFEILTASFEDSNDPPEVRSSKVDEFCIDTMRGILGDYYAERILEDGNDN